MKSPPRTSEQKAQSAERDSVTKALIGKQFHRFRIINFLGKGGMGRVFRAEDINLKRQTALKILSRSVVKKLGKEAQQQFLNEAQAVARLDHPNIVRIYEIDQHEGTYYITMEMLEGGDLHSLVEANGPFDIARACQVVAEAAEGLHHAHQLGVLHRDIKPSNLMLNREGRCKVADFGLAKLDQGDYQHRSEAVGTPYYISPEILQRENIGPGTDQYSLACTLWFLLTGKTVFYDESTKKLLTKHVIQAPPDIKKLREDIPDKLAGAILKALEKKPAKRHENLDQFARILRTYTIEIDQSKDISQLSVQTERASAHIPMKVWMMIAIALAIAVVLGIVTSNWLNQPSNPGTNTATATPTKAVGSTSSQTATGQIPETPSGFLSPDEAGEHIGQFVKVQGKITRVYRSNSAVFLNFYDKSEKGQFYLVMFPPAMDLLPNSVELFQGKWVQVTGTVSEFKGVPQIKISETEQIKVVPN